MYKQLISLSFCIIQQVGQVMKTITCYFQQHVVADDGPDTLS